MLSHPAVGFVQSGFLVAWFQRAVEHHVAQVVLQVADPPAGWTPEDLHQFVAVERALQLIQFVLFAELRDVLPQTLDSSRGFSLPVSSSAGDIGRDQIEQIMQQVASFEDEPSHRAISP